MKLRSARILRVNSSIVKASFSTRSHLLTITTQDFHSSRTKDAELLYAAMFDLAALADAGCVDQRNRQVIEVDLCVCRVARGAGNWTDDRAFFSHQLIQEAGFARVWFADDRDLDAVIFLFRFLWRKSGDQGIEQVTRPCAVNSRNSVWLAQPQLVELRR